MTIIQELRQLNSLTPNSRRPIRDGKAKMRTLFLLLVMVLSVNGGAHSQQLFDISLEQRHMEQFKSKSVLLVGNLNLNGPVDEVFQLFSPLGEKLWVPDWNPELLHPLGVSWEERLIFRTREETVDAIWVVTRLDRALHRVEYHRVEPGRYVARIEIICTARTKRTTKASTIYEFIGLSDSGNTEIAAMTQEEYDQKMVRWSNWINKYLNQPPAKSIGR
jgi:hypothetical protein